MVRRSTTTAAGDVAGTAPRADVDPGVELDRQVQTLLDGGHPDAAGMSPEDLLALVAPLRQVAVDAVADRATGVSAAEGGRVPFVLVLTRRALPVEEAMRRTTLAGRSRPGFVDRSFEPGSLERFVPTDRTVVPGTDAYLLLDVDRGEEFCGVVPTDAMSAVHGRGRTLLTVEEGVALITQFPEVLVKNRCFSLGGSRCGDRRVPALWISQGAPKLGWCWEGNPHTWLGMASAGSRRAGR